MPFEAKEFSAVIQKIVSLKYLLYLPKDYNDFNIELDSENLEIEAKKFPLIIFLHGMGERGNDLELVKIHGLPRQISEGQNFDFIVACPQCPDNKFWGEIVEDEFINLVKELIEKYNVDTSRIYLTGLSMGGFGTWYYGRRYKSVFAALAPVCGGLDIKFVDPQLYEVYRNHDFYTIDVYKDIPIWNFHGAKDSLVALECSTSIVNALNDINGDIKFTVYPDLDHDSWTPTYQNPALYKWFLSKKNECFKI